MEKAWISTLGSIAATTEKKDSFNEQPALIKLKETPEKKDSSGVGRVYLDNNKMKSMIANLLYIIAQVWFHFTDD